MSFTSVNIADAKEEFTELVNRVAHNKERIILTRRGKEVAVLIPFEELSLLTQNRDKSDVGEALESLKEARKLGSTSLNDLKKELGKL